MQSGQVCSTSLSKLGLDAISGSVSYDFTGVDNSDFVFEIGVSKHTNSYIYDHSIRYWRFNNNFSIKDFSICAKGKK